jgi:hypothetical protein
LFTDVSVTLAVTTDVVSARVVVGVPPRVYVTVDPEFPVNVNPVPEMFVTFIVTLHPEADVAVN